MTRTHSKSKSSRRRLGFETLEDRRMMTVMADTVGPEPFSLPRASDDAYVVKQGSEQQEFKVLANDYNRPRYPYYFSCDLGAWNDSSYVDVYDSPGPLHINSVTAAGHGSVGISEDGNSVFYTPSADFTGIDQFTYTVVNEDGSQDEANVFINVAEPIFALPDWFRVDEESDATELDVLENDSSNVRGFYGSNNGDPSFTITSFGASSHNGSLSISEDGQRIDYTPAEGFEGLDTFTYTIEDEAGYQSEATVQVQVTTLDENNPDQAWKEQVEQRLLEAAVERWGYQFGSSSAFVSAVSPYIIYNTFVDWRTFVGSSDLTGSTLNNTLTTNGDNYSSTNVQVNGVDEGDIVKTDGDFLYMLSDWLDADTGAIEHQLIIIDVRDAANPTVVSRYEFDGDVTELYLDGDRLTVLSQEPNQVVVTVLDISDRAEPSLVYESTLHGTLKSSRAVGEFVYVVANSYNAMPLPTLEVIYANSGSIMSYASGFYETRQQFVARVQDAILDETSFAIETQNAYGELIDTHSLIDYSQMLAMMESDATPFNSPFTPINSLSLMRTLPSTFNSSFTSVVSFNVTGDDLGPVASTILSTDSTTDVYMSSEAVYLFGRSNSSYGQTSIQKLALDGTGNVEWVASGSVNGTLLNQFSADEHNGFLRVATTVGWRSNSLYVLQQSGDQLEVVGSLEGLAPGERIYSARFDGDRGFLVTYRKVDPLFVFDLSDPTNPEELGQLKISGYSNYLQLIDENHLLGIGREANGFGLFQEIQISIFDISDFNNPTLVHRYSFEGGRNLWSPLMEDAWNLGSAHTVSYFAGQQILTIPTYEGNGQGWSWARNGQKADVSMQVLSIDVDQGIELLGRVDMGDPFDPRHARSVRIGDVLYSISPETIKANELLNPENELGELAIGIGGEVVPHFQERPTGMVLTENTLTFDPATCNVPSRGHLWLGQGSAWIQVLERQDGVCTFEFYEEIEGGYAVYRVQVATDSGPVSITGRPGGAGVTTSFDLEGAELIRSGNLFLDPEPFPTVAVEPVAPYVKIDVPAPMTLEEYERVSRQPSRTSFFGPRRARIDLGSWLPSGWLSPNTIDTFSTISRSVSALDELSNTRQAIFQQDVPLTNFLGPDEELLDQVAEERSRQIPAEDNFFSSGAFEFDLTSEIDAAILGTKITGSLSN